jgi:hypothetical protein
VNRILKRTCHITIKLEQLEAIASPPGSARAEETPRRAREAAAGGAAAPAKPRARAKKKEAAV